MTRLEAHAQYKVILDAARRRGELRAALRELTLRDSFFRLVYVLNIVPRQIVDTDWVYDRSREVQASPWGHVDLWFREGFKSTIITQNGIIGDILNYPEETTCLFSFNRPNAKKLAWPIVQELESNTKLKELFPEILWQDPRRDAKKWNQDEGYILRRRYNRKEPTLMVSGLVDGMPTGMHFERLRYDDVEVPETVRSPEMLEKAYDAMRVSYNIGVTNSRRRSWVGTIYAFNDIYQRLINEGVASPRIYPATRDGQMDGEPWIWTREQLAAKIRDMGSYVASCQLFLNPVADSGQKFLEAWLRFWRAQRLNGLNIYILVDPASAKKKDSDYTVFTVVGLGADRNYYVIKQVRDRLSLQERANILFKLHQDYRPRAVGYEKYGMQADIEYMLDRMERDNYRFGIIELGGIASKADRIKRLMPYFQDGRVYLPESQPYEQYDGKIVDLTKVFRYDEYNAFPYPVHDDMLDCLARILDEDLCAVWPMGDETNPLNIGAATGLDMEPELGYDPLWIGLR